MTKVPNDRIGRRWQDWLESAVLGALAGTLFLGIGGRVAMRGIAIVAGQPPGFSVGGTATIVFLGMVSGVVGAVVLHGLHLMLPARRVLRAAVFWTFLLLITLRGLRPVDTRRLVWFVPLVVFYGALLQVLWCRARRKREVVAGTGILHRPATLPEQIA